MVSEVILTGRALQRVNDNNIPDEIGETFEFKNDGYSAKDLKMEKYSNNEVIITTGYSTTVLLSRKEIFAAINFICDTGVCHFDRMEALRKFRAKEDAVKEVDSLLNKGGDDE